MTSDDGGEVLPSRPTHECITGIVFPRWCGIYNEMILKVADAERCGRINACRQAARRVLLSMRHGVALSSRTGIDLSALDSGTLCAAGVRLLRCNISADLLFHGGPPLPSRAVLSLCCRGGFRQSLGWLHIVCTDTCDCALESCGLVMSDGRVCHARIYNFLLQDPKGF